MTFSQIADLVFEHPKIQDGFIQHQIGLSHLKAKPLPGGWGHEYSDRRIEEYRVVLYTAGKGDMAEMSGPKLPEVIRAAFTALKIEVPKQLLAK